MANGTSTNAGIGLRVLERLTDPPGEANADWVEGRGDCVLWMDGAAPVNAATTRSGLASDAAWLVRHFARSFFARLTPEQETEALVAEVLEQLAREYAGLGSEPVSATPFACFGAARLFGETLELTNAGDCVLLYEDDDGRVASFGYSSVSLLERRAIAFLRDVKARTGAGHTEALQATVPLILDNVAQRNRRFGYDVIEPVSGLSPRLERVLVSARNGRRLLAMSDGFYRAVDTYHLFSREELFEAAFASGLPSILAALRRAEEQDPEALTWPRLKLRDDATAIAFMVEDQPDEDGRGGVPSRA